MGKTYRSWQKRTPRWADERHSEQRKRNFGERKDCFRLTQERNTTDEHLLSDQEPARRAGS